MEQYLTWAKDLFGSNYQVFNGTQIKSSLLFDNWKNSARGISSERNYIFRTEGFANPTTKIIDENGELLGTITYDGWHTKAILNLKSGEQFAWNFTNGWYTKWTITDFKGKQIFYDAATGTGRIAGNIDDEIILLTGLFIKEYYSRSLILIIIFIILIPIITRGIF